MMFLVMSNMHINIYCSFQGCDTESCPEPVCNGDTTQISQSPDVVHVQNEKQTNKVIVHSIAYLRNIGDVSWDFDFMIQSRIGHKHWQTKAPWT